MMYGLALALTLAGYEAAADQADAMLAVAVDMGHREWAREWYERRDAARLKARMIYRQAQAYQIGVAEARGERPNPALVAGAASAPGDLESYRIDYMPPWLREVSA